MNSYMPHAEEIIGVNTREPVGSLSEQQLYTFLQGHKQGQ